MSYEFTPDQLRTINRIVANSGESFDEVATRYADNLRREAQATKRKHRILPSDTALPRVRVEMVQEV